jgi:hypothetical protein
MTVYVDDVQHPFGNMIMCHMWASRTARRACPRPIASASAGARRAIDSRRRADDHRNVKIGKRHRKDFSHVPELARLDQRSRRAAAADRAARRIAS